MVRLSKKNAAILELVYKSSMSVDRIAGEGLRIIVKGPAAKIPSTSNSRMNWFPKKQILKMMEEGKYADAYRRLKQADVISMINPDFQVRLSALTTLWQNCDRNNIKLPLPADKLNRWVVMLLLPESTNRMDSHNLAKPICDWLQEQGIIENDKYVDCVPFRNTDFQINPEKLLIGLRPQTLVKEECKNLIRQMLA